MPPLQELPTVLVCGNEKGVDALMQLTLGHVVIKAAHLSRLNVLNEHVETDVTMMGRCPDNGVCIICCKAEDVGVALNFVLNAVTGACDVDTRARELENGLAPGHYAYSFTKDGKQAPPGREGMEETCYRGGKRAPPDREGTEAARCAPPGRQEASPDASGLGQSDHTMIMDVV